MVEEHRAGIMAKLGADNPVQLVDRALFMGFLDTEGVQIEQQDGQ